MAKKYSPESIKNSVKDLIPNRYKLKVVRGGGKNLAVHVKLSNHPQHQKVSKALRSHPVRGVYINGLTLVISGEHKDIVDRVRECKEHILLSGAA